MKKYLVILYLCAAIGIVFADQIQSVINHNIPNVINVVKKPGSWIIIVDQTEKQSPITTRIVSDKEYTDGLIERGLFFRYLDDNATGDDQEYTDLAKEIGFPTLIIIDKEGNCLVKQPLPPTIDLVDEIVKKYTGL